MQEPQSVFPAPPLRLSWSSGTKLKVACTGPNTLYGITEAGKIVAYDSATGAVRWQSTGNYLPHHLTLNGLRLFAFRLNEGLCLVDDNGSSVTERLVASFGATETVKLCAPSVDGSQYYYVVNQGLYASDQEKGLQFVLTLGESTPYTVTVVAPREVLLLDGKARPSRYRVGQDAFELIWEGESHGTRTGDIETPYVISGNTLILAAGRDIIAYNLSTGRIVWRISDRAAQRFAVRDGVLYGSFAGATVRALEAASGRILWERQYVYNLTGHGEYGVAVTDTHVYFGGLHAANADGSLLFALNRADGTLDWISRAANANWAGGIPLTNGTHLFCIGSATTGAYGGLATAPQVTRDHILVDPRPLRGQTSQFGTGKVRVNLPVSARVSISAYRETDGLGARLVNNANWAAGPHEVDWSPAGAGGFTEANQFGFILVDVEETGKPVYTQAMIVPVNTFPDIIWHWAKANVEAMVYSRFVSGYPNQNFMPDNLVNRAESSVIIAKTLGLERPGAGFQTKFTDIGTHWARDSIMALEERGVIGGFQEPDGSFTFRPNLNMTRAQEARILVRAYEIPPAPGGFATRFRDITGHWAEADIRALESAGYVNGFQEPDGSRTYRPEQNLTRAELCTVVVRIRNLTR